MHSIIASPIELNLDFGEKKCAIAINVCAWREMCKFRASKLIRILIVHFINLTKKWKNCSREHLIEICVELAESILEAEEGLVR